MKTERPNSPRNYLNQRQQALAQKHQQRLQQITTHALQAQQSKESLSPAWKPALVATFSLLLLIVLINITPTHSPAPAETDLPAWLTDTEVPLTLIENLDFYDWLAQQPEHRHAQEYKALTLAINAYYQYRPGQRRTTGNPAQRLSRTAPHAGTLPR